MKKVVCSTCGSDQVEGVFWVNLNTHQIIGPQPSFTDTWCENCQEVVDPIPYDQYKEKDNE